jgi:parallel beta-helix repeat protein
MKKTITILLCSILITSFAFVKTNGTDIIEKDGITHKEIPKSTSHDPIIINGSDGYEWGDYPEISGSGSLDNPYALVNVSIDAGGFGSGIFIKNTEVYFEIRDCNITNTGYSNSEAGIRLENCLNINITRCNISWSNYGIYIISSENILLFGNYVCNNSAQGIFLEESQYITFSENQISENVKNGIYVKNSFNATLSGNLFYENENGIVEINSNNSTLLKNTIYGNKKNGILLVDSDFANASSNQVYDNFENGIFLQNSHNANLSRNDIYTNRWGGIILNISDDSTILNNNIYDVGKGIFLLNSNNSTLLINTVSDTKENGIYIVNSYFSNVSSNIINNNYGNGVFLVTSHNSTLSLNEIYTNTGDGIFLDTSHNSSITNNSIQDNGDGISLLNSENSFLLRNYIYENNENGLDLINANANMFSQNKISDNYWNGIHLDSSYQNIFFGNRVYDNYRGGIYIDESHDNIFSGNTVNYNYLDGMYLENSEYNTLSGNYISENHGDGIYLNNSHNTSISGGVILKNDGFGIFLDAVSNDTTIWSNNIVNNTMDQAYSLSSSSAWDNGTVGNYWGDYTAKYPDAQNVGLFWDTPYEIDELSSLDNYPLFQPILPDVPVLITTTSTVDTAPFVLEWVLVNCAEIYEIYIDDMINVTTIETSLELMLDLNGIYEIEVVAVNVFGESLPSSRITITIEIPPEVPVLFPIWALSGVLDLIKISPLYKKIAVQWTTLNNVDFYNIYVDGILAATTSDNSTDIIIEVNGVYNITVTAVNNIGESLPSIPIVVVVNITPVFGYILSVFGILALIGGIFIMTKLKKIQLVLREKMP